MPNYLKDDTILLKNIIFVSLRHMYQIISSRSFQFLLGSIHLFIFLYGHIISYQPKKKLKRHTPQQKTANT